MVMRMVLYTLAGTYQFDNGIELMLMFTIGKQKQITFIIHILFNKLMMLVSIINNAGEIYRMAFGNNYTSDGTINPACLGFMDTHIFQVKDSLLRKTGKVIMKKTHYHNNGSKW